MSKINALVTGAGGFVGHHLVKALVKRGYYVRGVDLKMPEYELSDAHEFMVLDLRERHACDEAVKGIDDVYNLAADMGGIGYITSVHADVARHNVLIDVQMLEASHKAGVRRFFYSSSACFVGGTPVMTDDGVKAVENVQVGDRVLTHLGRFRLVTQVYKRAYSGELIEVKSPGLPVLCVTSDHRFWSTGNEWVRAEFLQQVNAPSCQIVGCRVFDLGEPDRLVQAFYEVKSRGQKWSRTKDSLDSIRKKFSVSPNTITRIGRGVFPKRCDPVGVRQVDKNFDVGFFMGLYLAEGWIELSAQGHRRIMFAFNDGEEDLLEHIQRVLFLQFAVPASRVRMYKMHGQRGFKVCVCSERLAALMERCFYDSSGRKARNKTLRNPILDSPPEFLQGLLSGWWRGDGCVTQPLKRQRRFLFSSSSWRLIHAARIILHWFGVETSMQVRDSHLGMINGRLIAGKEFYSIYPVGNLHDDLIVKVLSGKACLSDVPMSRKVSVKRTLPVETTVYNLEVEEDNSYVVQGMAVHNCIYPVERQGVTAVEPLAEWEAYPANPEPAYGWEKLFMEEMCKYYREDKKLSTRIARIHNCFGMLGTYQGGREKAPAALCRKIASVSDGGTIEVWGDGEQTRSFLYIDDCVAGICRIALSEVRHPLNVGSAECVTINELINMISQIAGKKVHTQYDLARPQGVRGRNSDNTLIRNLLGWEPSTKLYDGLVPTYRWIEQQVRGGSIDSVGKSQ